MIFKIKNQSIVNLNMNSLEIVELFALIKELIYEESGRGATRFNVRNSTLSFKTGLFSGGRGSRMFLIDGGEISVNTDNNITTLVYEYRIGRVFIYYATLFLLVIVLNFHTLSKTLHDLWVFIFPLFFGLSLFMWLLNFFL